MLSLKKLLLPVDYSARCLAAADCVRLLATRSAVEVTVLHVTDQRAQRCADEEVIKAFSDRLSEFDVNFSELAGDPAQRIIEYSRSQGTDLIVMPTRARGVLRGLLRGSVTAKVLRGVDCPVWTNLTEQAVGIRPRIAVVACAVDLGPRSANLLRWASDFAASFDARLAVIHASTQLVPVIGVVHDPEWRVHVAEVLQAELSELIATTGVNAEIRLASGEPAQAVSSAAKRLGTDVLVIGRSPKGVVRRLLSNALGIIRQSSCAVVSIEATSSWREKVVRDTAGRTATDECPESECVPAGAGFARHAS